MFQKVRLHCRQHYILCHLTFRYCCSSHSWAEFSTRELKVGSNWCRLFFSL